MILLLLLLFFHRNALYHFDFNLTMQSVVTWDIDSAVEAACISADNPVSYNQTIYMYSC